MRKLLLAASTGGHLAQLHRLSSRLEASDDSLWVTFDSPQSRGLLRGRRTLYVPYIAPRDWRSVAGAAAAIRKQLQNERFDEAFSTGAALALAALPVARASGIPASYIESVSRIEGPSLTGRILAASRAVKLYTQHETWAGGRWTAIPSVLDEYEAVESTRHDDTPPKIFVTLGTIRPYRFDSMVDAVLASGLADENTVWQVGETMRDDLPGSVEAHMSSEQFDAAIDSADIIITHAGVGTILGLMERGRFPVVVPRSASRGEHVDDHQHQAASLIDQAGVGVAREPESLDRSAILSARYRSLVPRGVESARA